MDNVNKDFTKILSDEELQATALQLDATVTELMEIGKEREGIYGDRAVLMKRARELQTEIQLAESEAIMQIQGSGKDAFGIVNGQKVYLTNDTARDAYRRNASKAQRIELAEIEGKIAEIEANLAKLNDTFNAKIEARRSIQAKANLQAAYLQYLS